MVVPDVAEWCDKFAAARSAAKAQQSDGFARHAVKWRAKNGFHDGVEDSVEPVLDGGGNAHLSCRGPCVVGSLAASGTPTSFGYWSTPPRTCPYKRNEPLAVWAGIANSRSVGLLGRVPSRWTSWRLVPSLRSGGATTPRAVGGQDPVSTWKVIRWSRKCSVEQANTEVPNSRRARVPVEAMLLFDPCHVDDVHPM